MSKYEDIIHLSRPVSETHPPMPMADRAAQFSPFAALTGYDAAVRETARLTDSRVELDESAKVALDSRLQQLSRGQPVTVTWFKPDPRKAGGAYVTATAPFVRLDPIERKLLLEGITIPVTDLYAIE